jgi:hypothetical protein
MDYLQDLPPIDMLIVDGPPKHTQKWARYPALPLLVERLGSKALILCDDADRRDERETVDRWLHEFPCLHQEHLETEKGALLLRMGKS